MNHLACIKSQTDNDEYYPEIRLVDPSLAIKPYTPKQSMIKAFEDMKIDKNLLNVKKKRNKNGGVDNAYSVSQLRQFCLSAGLKSGGLKPPLVRIIRQMIDEDGGENSLFINQLVDYLYDKEEEE